MRVEGCQPSPRFEHIFPCIVPTVTALKMPTMRSLLQANDWHA